VIEMDKIRMLERKLDVIKELKIRFAREEAQLIRMIKQEKMRRAGYGSQS